MRRGSGARRRRGFTLVEMTISIVVLSVLILASGGILIFLARGQIEVRDDNDAQNRLEIVRDAMVADFQAGTNIVFPTGAGDTGATSGGQEVNVQSVHYNAGTDVVTNKRYRWNWQSNTQTLTRYVSSETAPDSGIFGSETVTLVQTGITSFSVLRFNDGSGVTVDDIRLDFSLSTTEGAQDASLSYTITLRNVR